MKQTRRQRRGRPGAFLYCFSHTWGPVARLHTLHFSLSSAPGPSGASQRSWTCTTEQTAPAHPGPLGAVPPRPPRRQTVSQPRSPALAEPARAGLHEPVHLGTDHLSPALGSPPAPRAVVKH